MAGEKSGDNKLFQIMTLLVTSIVAPITVYFATSAINKANNPPPTPVPTVVQSAHTIATKAQPAVDTPLQATFTFTPGLTLTADLTLTPPVGFTSTPAVPTPTLPPTVTNTATSTATAVPTAVPTATAVPTEAAYGIQNPSGVISSGSPAVVNNLALSVEQQDITLNGRYVMVNLHVRNLGKEKQTFRYAAKSVTLKDSQGKLLQPFYGDKKPVCKVADLDDEKSIQIDPTKEITVHSVVIKDVGKWCGRDSADLLPIYAGPISEDAQSLLIEFAEFGPFSGFTIEVKLK